MVAWAVILVLGRQGREQKKFKVVFGCLNLRPSKISETLSAGVGGKMLGADSHESRVTKCGRKRARVMRKSCVFIVKERRHWTLFVPATLNKSCP